jgi:hypothetical protein
LGRVRPVYVSIFMGPVPTKTRAPVPGTMVKLQVNSAADSTARVSAPKLKVPEYVANMWIAPTVVLISRLQGLDPLEKSTESDTVGTLLGDQLPGVFQLALTEPVHVLAVSAMTGTAAQTSRINATNFTSFDFDLSWDGNFIRLSPDADI